MSRLRYRLLDVVLATGLAPAPLLVAGARAGAVLRERGQLRGGIAAQDARRRQLLEWMRSGPIAEQPQRANEQHYELPPEFFELFLGPRRKYSGCLWEPGTSTLAEAEEAMLALSARRAQIADGMRILDLGCGWGSLTLWLAERYPACQITAVSNSQRQRQLIEDACRQRGLGNVEALTADVNAFEPSGRFDRVVSIEMFEHMRNWRELLRRVADWLREDGRLFVHVFSHRTLAYRFEGTWAAERFFTAGLMPSHDLLAHFQEHMLLEDSWALPGTHYARTLDAWLARLQQNSARARSLLRDAGMGAATVRAALGRWRLFLLSTREMWGWRAGNRWLISHYRLRPRGGSGTNPEVLRTYSA